MQKTFDELGIDALVQKAFETELSTIHKWKVVTAEGEEVFPEHDFAFYFEEIKEDKEGTPYFIGKAYYPNGDKRTEILYMFSSLETQIGNIFGTLDEAVGRAVLIKYQGKKENPNKKGQKFHSCYVMPLGTNEVEEE